MLATLRHPGFARQQGRLLGGGIPRSPSWCPDSV